MSIRFRRCTPAPLLRPARPEDAPALGAILSGWAGATRWMRQGHCPVEATGHAALLIAGMTVTVACPPAPLLRRPLAAPRAPGPPLGFLARRGGFIHALYLAPEARRKGMGRALLAAAKADCPRLTLWVFAANHPARAFYAAQGFVPVEIGDGSGNDEGLPELRLEWRREPAGAASQPRSARLATGLRARLRPASRP